MFAFIYSIITIRDVMEGREKNRDSIKIRWLSAKILIDY